MPADAPPAAQPGAMAGLTARTVRPGASGWSDRILNGLETGLDVAAASHVRACFLLLALGLACFLPGFVALQPMDRDEPRFAQASKQMLEAGDYVDIRFQAEARHKKPVGIYWAQALSVAAGEALGVEAARTTIALYRIPSLIGALAAALLAYWAALAFLPRRGALLAAALFTACIMLAAEARLAKTDALLCACCVAAMGALARAYLGRARLERDRGPATITTAAVFWLALALGVLIKGPMVPLFAGLTVGALGWRDRSVAWVADLRPRAGLAATLAIVAPWFLVIAWKSGGAFFGASVGQDMLAKVGGGAEKHWGPPGAYALAFFGTFWPGAAFAALSVPFAWRHRGQDWIAFLIAWILPAWLLFEAVPTKLPHYVLPLMPAVAILTVTACRSGTFDIPRRREMWGAGLVLLVPVGLTLGLTVAAWRLDARIPLSAFPFLLSACALAGLAWAGFRQGRAQAALVAGIGASVLLSGGVLGLAQRDLPSLKVSQRLAEIAQSLPCPAPRVASLGYREPSLVFLVGTDLALPETEAEAARFLGAGGCRLVFVEARRAEAFRQARVEAAIDAQEIAMVHGFNINGGKPLAITAYAAGLTPSGSAKP